MPRRSTAEYSFIKTTSEVGYGTMTQCIQARNVERANAQLFGNLLQKINTKLGGTNTVVSKASKALQKIDWTKSKLTFLNSSPNYLPNQLWSLAYQLLMALQDQTHLLLFPLLSLVMLQSTVIFTRPNYKKRVSD